LNKDILKKPSGLVVIKNTLTKNEHKLYNVLLRDALQDKRDNPQWETTFSEIKAITGISSNDHIKQAFKGLENNKIEIKDFVLKENDKKWAYLSSRFIAGWKYDKEEQVIIFSFEPILYSMLKEEFIYSQINLKVLKKLNNKHSLWLYELISSYKGIGKIEMTIEKIRELSGIKDGQYKMTGELKRSVIQKAVDEINKQTSYSLTFEENKKGRNIKSFTFKFFDHAFNENADKKIFRDWLSKTMFKKPINLSQKNVRIYFDKNSRGNTLLFDGATQKPLATEYAKELNEYLYTSRQALYEWIKDQYENPEVLYPDKNIDDLLAKQKARI